MYKRVKNNQHLLIAPVITLLITGVFFALNGVFPFGNKTVSWCDMNQQTIPLLMDFKDILDGKSDIFYSTANAGGMNFWGVFLFFISSPLYIAVKFVEKSHLVYFVNILFAVKLALSAFTASVYFNKIHKKLKTEFSVLLSVTYALCGYGMMYYQTLVWLDIMFLFPLLVLAVHRMCRQGKPLMYGVVLSLMMTTCFYISYMIIIYLLIAVPLYIAICCKAYERKKASLSFLCTSFISALITAPIWLCAFLQTSESARGEGMLSEIMYKPFFENGANKFCVIMCTALCIAVLPFFIKNKITKRKNVRYNLILLLFLAIPLFADPVNKMWHTGSYQSFPLRYGFIVVFTLLILTAYYFEYSADFGRTSKEYFITVSILAAAYTVISAYVVTDKKKELSSYTNILKVDKNAFKILFGLFLTAFMIYIICIYIQRKKLIGSRALCFVLMLMLVGEVFTSMTVNIGYAVNKGGVLKTSAALEYDKNNKPYYRTKTEKKYLHVNMVGGLGYNSLAHYTSLTNEDYMFAMKKLGYSSYWMEVGSNGGTVLTDALLAVKYSIGTYFDFESHYDITNLTGDLERGESSIVCPVGITSEMSPDAFEKLGDGSRVDIQKSLAEKYFGNSEMIHEYYPTFTADGSFEHDDSGYSITAGNEEGGICQMRYSIDIKDKQILYFDIFDRLSNDLSEDYYSSADVYVNGNCIAENYPSQKNNGILTLGEFENTTAEILIIINKDVSVKSLGVFGIDTEALKRCTEKIKGCDFHIQKGTLTAEYTSDSEKWLYMSIPYDKGLEIYINGRQRKLVKTNEAFCAVKLDAGINRIAVDFSPLGMKTALILSFSGIVLLIISAIRKFRIPVEKAGNISYKLMFIISAAVITAVYLMPVIVRIAVSASEFFK